MFTVRLILFDLCVKEISIVWLVTASEKKATNSMQGKEAWVLLSIFFKEETF